MVKVELWSDIVCPFCWIGKRHLEEAIARSGLEGEVEIVPRAFELDPHRRGTSTVFESIAKKYGGGVVAARAMTQRVEAMGAEAGLTFDFEHALVASTFDAHRLVALAGRSALAPETVERFMRAHFQEGADVSDHGTLRRLAREVGLDAAEVTELLASDAFAEEVRSDEETARAHRVSGVPFAVIDGRFGVHGAQPVEVFIEALSRARASQEPPTAIGASDGAACDDDRCDVP
ncbi:MAG: DsbA family oxidoreductase [Polyangiaceae bacterium]|nr:DsbA family oxidoreductase [Polyangiaceae bacterium]